MIFTIIAAGAGLLALAKARQYAVQQQSEPTTPLSAGAATVGGTADMRSANAPVAGEI